MAYTIMSEVFSDMSITYYNYYISNHDDLKRMNGGRSWDIADHTPEENGHFFAVYRATFYNAVSAVVFQALAVEAYVNLFGVKIFGEAEFYNKFERVSTVNKLKAIYEKIFCNGERQKEFEDPIKDQIDKLFTKRNHLVHYKSRYIDVQNSSMDEFFAYMYDQQDFVWDRINDDMKVYRNLKSTQMNWSGSEKDLTRAEEEESEALRQQLLKEMIEKAYGIK